LGPSLQNKYEIKTTFFISTLENCLAGLLLANCDWPDFPNKLVEFELLFLKRDDNLITKFEIYQ
jgi:hypothetical protein